MKLLNFPIGYSDFETIREQSAEYVDKTQLIAEVLRDEIQVLLFPRPRRFGKTLNLSMLRYFLISPKKALARFLGGSLLRACLSLCIRGNTQRSTSHSKM